MPCPACGHDRLFEVEEALIPNYESSNGIESLTLTCHYGPSGTASFFGSSNERVAIGLRARVCAGCGLVSWFVRDLAELASFADLGQGGVRRGRG